MNDLEHLQLLYKEALVVPGPWFTEAPLKETAQNMSKTYSMVWTFKRIESMHGHWIVSLGQQVCIFKQCIAFHPINLVHLRLCQYLQGPQVGWICRMQLRPIDV